MEWDVLIDGGSVQYIHVQRTGWPLGGTPSAKDGPLGKNLPITLHVGNILVSN